MAPGAARWRNAGMNLSIPKIIAALLTAIGLYYGGQLGLSAAVGRLVDALPMVAQATTEARDAPLAGPNRQDRPAARAAPGEPQTFEEAKRMLAPLWAKWPYEIYCQCKFDRGKVDPSCPVRVRQFKERADRVEAEHVVPASAFGHLRPCWREAAKGAGREACKATDPLFAKMEGDPHNLRPAIGALNAIRSNHRYGMVPGERREFGSCDFEVSKDGEGRFVEPPAVVQGDVARVYFYFEWRYGLRISEAQRRLFVAWAAQDPVDEAERFMHAQIAAQTHTCNPFIAGPKEGLTCTNISE